MSGANTDLNGIMSEGVSAAAEIAVETASTHVGTPNMMFSFVYNNAIITFYPNSPFIADAGFYAALNAGAAPVTWSN